MGNSQNFKNRIHGRLQRVNFSISQCTIPQYPEQLLVTYGVISNSGITRDTSCQCLPDVANFQILHRNYQWLLKNIIL